MAGNDTKAVTEVIKKFMEKQQFGEDFQFESEKTNNSEGGTKFKLKKELISMGLVLKRHRVNTCSLHNLQTRLRNAVKEVLSEACTIEQVIDGNVVNEYKKHYAVTAWRVGYNLFSYLEVEELSTFWDHASETFGLKDQKFHRCLVDKTTSDLDKD